jgi:hypothetical protein
MQQASLPAKQTAYWTICGDVAKSSTGRSTAEKRGRFRGLDLSVGAYLAPLFSCKGLLLWPNAARLIISCRQGLRSTEPRWVGCFATGVEISNGGLSW